MGGYICHICSCEHEYDHLNTIKETNIKKKRDMIFSNICHRQLHRFYIKIKRSYNIYIYNIRGHMK